MSIFERLNKPGYCAARDNPNFLGRIISIDPKDLKHPPSDCQYCGSPLTATYTVRNTHGFRLELDCENCDSFGYSDSYTEINIRGTWGNEN